MRFAILVSAALAILFANPVSAADDPWATYVNRQDRFAINLPGQPKIEEFTYTSEYKSPWKARRYTVEYEGYIYRMTVVDMSNSVLPANTDPSRDIGPGIEKRGAMAFAATNLRKTGQVTLDTYDQLQVIPGHKLEIILPDGRQNIVEMHTHYNFLYIQECISPKDAVPGYDVQSSMEFLDANGGVPRYDDAGFPGKVPLVSAAALAPRAPVPAGWINYVNRADLFALNLPSQPRVEEFAFKSAQGSPWMARRYISERDGHRYVLTAIDTSTTALTPDKDAFRNAARPASEKSGALSNAAWDLRKTGVVTRDIYQELQGAPGLRMEITLPDGRQSIVELYALSDRLYILESTAPKGAPPGYNVPGSLALLDANGNVPRYQDNGRTFPSFVTMTGDGAGAAGRAPGVGPGGAAQ